ncbi:MAG: ATP-dependent RecD-like DNA helicase [Candidatus Latescibacterota bacterium]|nr:ATP-dependent RecD-like DNA helicase [Candidatus Latescibacterota bacterium]
MLENTEKLRGTIERITYQSQDSGFTVAKLRPEGGNLKGLVTVVGQTLSLNAGESIVMDGEWSSHAQYGRQFKITNYHTEYPTTLDGVRKYLGSGMIKGIGSVLAKRIVDHFGEKSLDVIQREPGKLKEVEGLGSKRAKMITKGWKEQQEVHGVMLFLQSHDVGTGYAVKIWKQYGEGAVELMKENPYSLASDIWGIGFLTADRIAQNMGVEKESDSRILAGISYVLTTASNDNGHVFVSRDALLSACSEVLQVDVGAINSGVDKLVDQEDLICEDDRVYLPTLFRSEQGISTRLHQLAQIERIETGDVDTEIDVIQQQEDVLFAPRQRDALVKVLTSNVVVLTGGPGTGKTTTVNGMISLFEARGKRVVLTAPTGRAAKRMHEATGKKAKTIHRLLEFAPGTSFKRNFDNMLEADVIIVDEISMVDVLLMNALMRAIPISSCVILVGDVDQLPSVGPGSVLRNVIESDVVPVVTLNEIFRQGQTSQIVTYAHEINSGSMPDFENRKDSDFFFMEVPDLGEVAQTISDLCSRRLPKSYGFDRFDDIQVLSPMHRGESGVQSLNERLQNALNPKGTEVVRASVCYRDGDKVMQIRNNYDKDVFNGDIGRIESIDTFEQELVVRFGDRSVQYEFGELDELVLAYAITVHKSQGSEFRAVVVPITTQHFVMLQRNLIYTAITRAKSLVVMVGTKNALAIALKNNAICQRNTTLVERLREYDNNPPEELLI